MNIQIPDTSIVRILAREKLRKNFPLYKVSDDVKALEIRGDKIRLVYRTTEDIPEIVKGSTHLDMEFWFPRLCFLNSIEVREEERGKGMGHKLYLTCEEIARSLGCERLCQIPSGVIVVNGKFVETREDYLVRRGYSRVEGGQVEKIL